MTVTETFPGNRTGMLTNVEAARTFTWTLPTPPLPVPLATTRSHESTWRCSWSLVEQCMSVTGPTIPCLFQIPRTSNLMGLDHPPACRPSQNTSLGRLGNATREAARSNSSSISSPPSPLHVYPWVLTSILYSTPSVRVTRKLSGTTCNTSMISETFMSTLSDNLPSPKPPLTPCVASPSTDRIWPLSSSV